MGATLYRLEQNDALAVVPSNGSPAVGGGVQGNHGERRCGMV